MAVDATGMEGSFDFTLRWSANAMNSSPDELQDAPSIFQAVQGQL